MDPADFVQTFLAFGFTPEQAASLIKAILHDFRILFWPFER
jgi:hypothetical protein